MAGNPVVILAPAGDLLGEWVSWAGGKAIEAGQHLEHDLGARRASYGAGHYGMCGRSLDPRFVFAWPSARSPVMGAQQLADVTYSVSRSAPLARGNAFDEEGALAIRAAIERQIEAKSMPLVLSGLVYDDGIIDPRDIHSVLGMCPRPGTDAFGVFRM